MKNPETECLSLLLSLSDDKKSQLQFLSELGLQHFSGPAEIEFIKAICKANTSTDPDCFINEICSFRGDLLTAIARIHGECCLNLVPEVEAIEKLPGVIEGLKFSRIQRILKAS